jgi:hypothetical protein
VLLHGCHTSASVEAAAAEPVELGAVWLSAGAEAVIGAEGPLPDSVARDFVGGLAPALGAGKPLGQCFAAGLDAVRDAPAASWCGLRLWGDPRVRLADGG